MEQARKARARKQGAARENAVLEAEPPHRRVKAVGDPAKEQEEVPTVAKVREQAGALVVVAPKVGEKAVVIGNNKSSIQRINDN